MSASDAAAAARTTLANDISAEDVNQQWEAIVGFTDADHPANGQEAMMAMMQNLQNR